MRLIHYLFIVGQEYDNAYLPLARKMLSVISYEYMDSERHAYLNTSGGHKLCKVNKPHRSFSSKLFEFFPKSGPVFYLHSSLLKLSKLWDPNFSFNYLKQIHFLSQKFENLLKQGT